MSTFKKFFVLGLPKKEERCANAIYFVRLSSSTLEMYVTDKEKNVFEFDVIKDVSELTDNQNLLTEGDKNYVYNQYISSDVWTIEHPLNKIPSVIITDEDNKVYKAHIEYINNNKIVIFFNKPFSGKAILN